jgi:hypothetical protein
VFCLDACAAASEPAPTSARWRSSAGSLSPPAPPRGGRLAAGACSLTLGRTARGRVPLARVGGAVGLRARQAAGCAVTAAGARGAGLLPGAFLDADLALWVQPGEPAARSGEPAPGGGRPGSAAGSGLPSPALPARGLAGVCGVSRVVAVDELESGPVLRFADWPDERVPRRAAGVNTVRRAEDLIHAGMSGRGAQREDFVAPPGERAAAMGLRTRLNSGVREEAGGPVQRLRLRPLRRADPETWPAAPDRRRPPAAGPDEKAVPQPAVTAVAVTQSERSPSSRRTISAVLAQVLAARRG